MRTYEDNVNPHKAYKSKKAEYYEWKLNRKDTKAIKTMVLVILKTNHNF